MKISKNKYRKRLILAGIVATLCFAQLACNTKGEDVAEKKASVSVKEIDRISISSQQARSIGIQLGKIEKEMVSDLVRANGQVELPPGGRATVSLPIAGKIKIVKVLPGQAVKKGQLLATLESFEFIQLQQDYLQSSSQLIFLNKELERQKTLNLENVGARKNFEQAEANYRSTKTLMQALEAKLLMLGVTTSSLESKASVNATVAITSPVNGFVSAANVNLGKETVAGEALFEVVDKTELHIDLTVFEKDASKIKAGQKVLVQKNDGFERMPASVHMVGKVLEGEARTLQIHAHLTNKKDEEALIPGAYVNALISTGNRGTSVVPAAAVVRKGEHGFIFAEEKPNIYKRIKVQIGMTTDSGKIEIISKDNLDNLPLVTKGAYLLDAEFAKRSEPVE